jgi:hypothetical protein
MSTDNKFYETALSELRSGQTVAAIEAMALANVDGDDKKYEAQYIKLRVAQLQKDFNPETPRPWRRFFAKWIDLSLYNIVFFILIIFSIEQDISNSAILFALLAITLAPAQILDGIILAIFGSSLGKLIFGVVVIPPEGNTFLNSMKRTVLCLVYGMGFGIPMVNMFFIAYQHGKLKSQGQTSWDKKTGHKVVYAKGPHLFLGVIVIIILLIITGGMNRYVPKLIQSTVQVESSRVGSSEASSAGQDENKSENQQAAQAESSQIGSSKTPSAGQDENKSANQQAAQAKNPQAVVSKTTGTRQESEFASTQRAAEQGYANAQFNLGLMYDNGHGVQKDDRKAVEWFQKAADQGNAPAQFNLGRMANRE